MNPRRSKNRYCNTCGRNLTRREEVAHKDAGHDVNSMENGEKGMNRMVSTEIVGI